MIDLTLTPGIPRFLDVLRAVAEELVIESITVASEITEFSLKLYQEILKIVGNVDVNDDSTTSSRNNRWGSRDHSDGGVHALRERPPAFRIGLLSSRATLADPCQAKVRANRPAVRGWRQPPIVRPVP